MKDQLSYTKQDTRLFGLYTNKNSVSFAQTSFFFFFKSEIFGEHKLAKIKLKGVNEKQYLGKPN